MNQKNKPVFQTIFLLWSEKEEEHEFLSGIAFFWKIKCRLNIGFFSQKHVFYSICITAMRVKNISQVEKNVEKCKEIGLSLSKS